MGSAGTGEWKGSAAMARSTKQDRAQDASRAGLTGASEPAAMADPATRLAPVLEGARARGVADAFAMAGQAAILLGGAGEVLHACADAGSLLGAGLRLKDGRLVAGDEGDLGLARRLGDVLEGESGLCAPGITRSAAGGWNHAGPRALFCGRKRQSGKAFEVRGPAGPARPIPSGAGRSPLNPGPPSGICAPAGFFCAPAGGRKRFLG